MTVQIFTDQTGHFLCRYTTGSTDILVLYFFDTNYIHVEAVPSRTSYQIILAYQQAYKILVSQRLYLSLQQLFNKAPAALIAYLD